MTSPKEHIALAMEVASMAHSGQLDKAGQPYIFHPMHVAASMDADDIDGRIVAALHDVVEDTNVTLHDLLFKHGFHDSIIAAVDAISKRDGETNKQYWARVKANPLALRVKLKDIAHNSSEERLAALSSEESEHLRGKYARAMRFLLS